jgi:phosphomannomutase
VEAVAAVMSAIGESTDRTDGVTVDHPDWWFNLRPSNTEPLLRLNVEARTESECAAHVREILDLVAELSG